MKTILTIIVLLLLTLCGLGLAVEGSNAYEDCMAAGVQSQETCMFYAYN